LRFQKTEQKEQVSQKKRSVVSRNYMLGNFLGSAAFFFYHQIQLEFVYLKLVKRRLRLMLKKRGNRVRSRKVWVNLKANFPISKKSKNSRMGKGNGLLLRWVVRLKPFAVFMSFLGFSAYILIKLSKRINYLLKSKIFCVFRLRQSPCWANAKFIKYSTSQCRID
jgi:ribosomal protein L16/L10AE